MKAYGKLVRDRIPELIERQGKAPILRVLEGDEYVACLRQKLREEADEYLASGQLEELADLLEVILALLQVEGLTFRELNRLRLRKRTERGGFDRRLFLVGVEDG